MTESRLMGSLDDFIFIESPKIILSIKKSERGTHTKLVTVHRDGKTFKRKQRVGRKVIIKKDIKFESSHDYIKNEIGLDIDMREGEKATKDPLMGEQIIVSDDKGNKLDVWIKETSDMVQLSTIGSHEKGTGIGTKYLFGLKGYADVSGKKLVIPNMTPNGKKYFSRFDWLKDDHIKLEWEEGGEHQEYYPDDTMSYNLKNKEKKIIKSSLHPDNLTEIKSLYDAGVEVIGGIHEEETFICKFKDESSGIHKVMMKGEIVGEVGAYETSKIIGWDIVPETIQCDYGKGEGSCQKWINGSEPAGDFDDYGGEFGGGLGKQLKEVHLNDLSKIFILDMITGNFDRHDGNLIIDKNDKCWAIDNEMIGQINNAKHHIGGLKEFAEKGSGSYLPIFGILTNSFGDDPKMYQNFKDHVDKNIDMALNKKDEIIKYWSQYKDSELLNTSMPIKESVKHINFNIGYLEYYQNMEMNK